MSEPIAVALIAASVPAILTAIGTVSMLVWRWWRERRAERDKATKTVATLERAVAQRTEQVEALTELTERMGQTIARQDRRLERKDARIAHLETLLDQRRGSAL